MDRRPPLFTPAFLGIALAELAYFTAGGIELPVAPGFAAEILRADPAGVGLAVGAFGASALALRPFVGGLADRSGRRKLMVAGAFAYAVITAAHIAAPSLAVMVVLRLLLGVAEAFFFVASLAAVADLAPASRRGEAMSYSSLSLYLGVAFGPLLGDWLVRVGAYPAAWAGAAALAAIAGLVAIRIPETGHPDRGAEVPTRLLHPAALLPGAAIAAMVGPMAAFLAFVRFQAKDVGIAEPGPVLLVFGLVVVACRLVFARLPDRVEPTVLARAGLLSGPSDSSSPRRSPRRSGSSSARSSSAAASRS
jgi:MFS family permease